MVKKALICVGLLVAGAYAQKEFGVIKRGEKAFSATKNYLRKKQEEIEAEYGDDIADE